MKARVPLIVLAASTLLLSACGGGGDDASTNSGMQLVNPGTLTVCSDVPFPPFELEKDGKYTGFDIDMITAIASGMDLKTEVKDVGFDGLQSGASLAAGQCDIGASAMTITADRKKNLAFSDPYYDSKQSLLVPAGSDITSIKDLAGKKVGVQQGTTGAKYAEEHVPKGTKLISFPSDAELYPAVQSGGVAAVLQDLPVNLGHTEGGKFTIAEQYDTDEHYGFAMKKKGSEELVKAVNEQLTTLRDNGKYKELYNKYFATK